MLLGERRLRINLSKNQRCSVVVGFFCFVLLLNTSKELSTPTPICSACGHRITAHLNLEKKPLQFLYRKTIVGRHPRVSTFWVTDCVWISMFIQWTSFPAVPRLPHTWIQLYAKPLWCSDAPEPLDWGLSNLLGEKKRKVVVGVGRRGLQSWYNMHHVD